MDPLIESLIELAIFLCCLILHFCIVGLALEKFNDSLKK